MLRDKMPERYKRAFFQEGPRSFYKNLNAHHPIFMKFHRYDEPDFWCIRIPEYKNNQPNDLVEVTTKQNKVRIVRLLSVLHEEYLHAHIPNTDGKEIGDIKFQYWNFEWRT